MGCGISTLDVEDASMNQHSKAHRHAIVPPIIDKKKDSENGDDGSIGLLHGNNNNKDVIIIMRPLDDEGVKDKGSNGERLKEKSAMEKNKEEAMMFDIEGKEKHSGNKYYAKNVEENHEDRDDSFIGPGSPSFREYCIDYDCEDRSSVVDSNDCDSMERTKNNSDGDLSKRNHKLKNEGNVISNNEHEKKERRRRGLRNVINKGKTRGRKNLRNFVCYNGNNVNESITEGSFNKIVAKVA